MKPVPANSATLTGPYGDPFVDVGATVLRQLLALHPEWKPMDALGYVASVYVNDWQNKLHAFFLNSSITNPANKGREMEQTQKYYAALLDESAAHQQGECRVSGQREALFSAGRENQILTGSGAFINFNHAFDRGFLLGKGALFCTFFTPLGCVLIGDKVALVHSNRPEVNELLVAVNRKRNLNTTTTDLHVGVAKSAFGNPANVLFAYAEAILGAVEQAAQGDSPPVALTLYHFTNFGAKPDLQLHHLSARVFNFYQQMLRPNFQADWTWFVRAHYRHSKFKGARARPDTPTLLMPAKPNEAPEMVEQTTYQAWINPVYLRLLNGQSLIPLIRTWSRLHHFPFSLTTYYCQKLLNMDRKTLDKIAYVARYVVTETDDKVIKQTITRLSTARASHEVRLQLVSLQRRNYNSGATEPLIRLDEYVLYLFPDGVSWREIRDLLLIALYEQLHEQNRQIELDENVEEVIATEEGEIDSY